jgi:hypothetical protein
MPLSGKRLPVVTNSRFTDGGQNHFNSCTVWFFNVKDFFLINAVMVGFENMDFDALYLVIPLERNNTDT